MADTGTMTFNEMRDQIIVNLRTMFYSAIVVNSEYNEIVLQSKARYAGPIHGYAGFGLETKMEAMSALFDESTRKVAKELNEEYREVY